MDYDGTQADHNFHTEQKTTRCKLSIIYLQKQMITYSESEWDEMNEKKKINKSSL
jgi:hypothetical protein